MDAQSRESWSKYRCHLLRQLALAVPEGTRVTRPVRPRAAPIARRGSPSTPSARLQPVATGRGRSRTSPRSRCGSGGPAHALISCRKYPCQAPTPGGPADSTRFGLDRGAATLNPRHNRPACALPAQSGSHNPDQTAQEELRTLHTPKICPHHCDVSTAAKSTGPKPIQFGKR